MDYLFFLYLDKMYELGFPQWFVLPLWYVVPFVIIAVMLVSFVLVLVLAERKMLAFYTLRKGPNRVGFYGCLQTVADAIKLLFKEDVTPCAVDKILFFIAPLIAFVPTMVVWGMIPFNNDFKVINSSLGCLLYPVVASIPLMGILLAGYASNNKYALLGSMRSIVQAISYELPMITSILSIVVLAGTMNLFDIVNSQSSIFGFLGWFFIPAFVGFLVFYVCALAELNRTPFDFSEAESELVSGYNTEYSGMKFALFFLGEYSALFIMSAFIVTLFFGGFLSPFGFYLSEKFFNFTAILPTLIYLEQIFWLLTKTFVIIYSVIWLRATLPRFRIDFLISLAWKILLPLSILNFLIVCFYKIWCIK